MSTTTTTTPVKKTYKPLDRLYALFDWIAHEPDAPTWFQKSVATLKTSVDFADPELKQSGYFWNRFLNMIVLNESKFDHTFLERLRVNFNGGPDSLFPTE